MEGAVRESSKLVERFHDKVGLFQVQLIFRETVP